MCPIKSQRPPNPPCPAPHARAAPGGERARGGRWPSWSSSSSAAARPSRGQHAVLPPGASAAVGRVLDRTWARVPRRRVGVSPVGNLARLRRRPRSHDARRAVPLEDIRYGRTNARPRPRRLGHAPCSSPFYPGAQGKHRTPLRPRRVATRASHRSPGGATRRRSRVLRGVVVPSRSARVPCSGAWGSRPPRPPLSRRRGTGGRAPTAWNLAEGSDPPWATRQHAGDAPSQSPASESCLSPA